MCSSDGKLSSGSKIAAIVASVMHCLVTMGRVVPMETVFVVNLWGMWTKTKCACSILKPLIVTCLGLVEIANLYETS